METNTISKTELIEQQSDTFFIEKEKKDQKELTFVKPEVFKKMVTDQEDTKVYEEWLKKNSKYEPIYRLYQKPFQEDFQMTRFSLLNHFLKKNIISVIDIYKLSTYNAGLHLSYGKKISNFDQTLLTAIFVVQDNKIVQECRKSDMSDNFDIARIVLDPDQFGVQVHTKIYECQRITKPKIEKEKIIKIKRKMLPKESRFSCVAPLDEEELNLPKTFELDDVLKNDKYRRYFKLHMIKEFDSENLLFYEEVVEYKNLPKEKRIEHAKKIFDLFFAEDSIYELNLTITHKEVIKKGLDSGNEDLFDDLLNEIKRNTFKSSFSRFLKSELIIEMQKKTFSKKRSFFLTIESN